jgi:hypothetical protein
MNENWEEHEAAPNGMRYLGHAEDPDEVDDPNPVLLAPVNEHAESPYGMYFSSNPAFVFGRERLAAVLELSPEKAIVALMRGVPANQISQGEPFYVLPTDVR